MVPLSALTIAGTFAWGIFETVGGGVLGGQSDKYFCNAVGQIKEKFSQNTPEENRQLVRAFRRSCLKATLQICARRRVSLGGPSSSLAMPGRNLFGTAPLSVMAQDESEWLKKAEEHLNAKIDELNKNITFLPEQPSEKYQTLINPMGASCRERADSFRADLTDDAIAEVRDAAGDPPESFNAEMQADWFSLVCNDFQVALGKNQELTNRFQNTTLVEIVSDVGTLKLMLREVLELLRGRTTGDDNQPHAVFNLLNLEEKVYDREVESKAVLAALSGAVQDKRERFLLLTAPSGFGKSFLLTKVLQAVTDGRAIKDQYQQMVRKILRVDCRATQSVGGIVGDAGSLIGRSKALRLSYDQSRETNEPIAEWLNKNLFPALQQEGTAWLLVENFEAWLDAETGYTVKDAGIRQFLNALFEGNHSLRVLFLSQDDPEPDVKRRLKKLEQTGDALYEGLPEPDALAYLRTEGKDVGLDQADENLLKEFLRRVHRIPQALASLIGYLTSIEDYSFQEFMVDTELWEGFDEYEGAADTDNEGIRRTKALIAKQIERQSDEVKLLLCALTFFEREAPKQALELLFKKKAQAATAISRLTAHKLATTKPGLRGTMRYDLHAYFREQTAKNLLPQFEAWLLSNGAGYEAKLHEAGVAAHKAARYRLATDLFLLEEKIARDLLATLKKRAGDDEAAKQVVVASLEYFLASALMMKGNSLDSLRRLREALTAYDESITLFQSLVESGKAAPNDLASAYMNKGVALRGLGRLSEAIAEFDKAISIRAPLVKDGREELADDLAKACANKAVALEQEQKWDEALDYYNRAIQAWEMCIAQLGLFQLMPNLLKCFRLRVDLWLKLERWAEAASDVIAALSRFIPYAQHEQIPDELKQAAGSEVGAIRAALRQLSPENREQFYAAAGEPGEVLRQWVEG
ncbi:MAG: hypothetical protein ACR2G4_13185 [Pyrinomonadaceae bacterium]